jgi:hypothetical protein
VSWDTHFAKDRLHLELHLGWEQNVFFQFNRILRYSDHPSQGFSIQEQGNLSTQGLTVGGRFDF